MKLNLSSAIIFCLASSFATAALAQSAGEDVFKSKCALCHGTDGMADTPAGKALKAASFKDPAIIKTPDAELIAIVKSGKNKMPSYKGKIPDDQIKGLVAYIRGLAKK